jgi:hypothetical protein
MSLRLFNTTLRHFCRTICSVVLICAISAQHPWLYIPADKGQTPASSDCQASTSPKMAVETVNVIPTSVACGMHDRLQCSSCFIASFLTWKQPEPTPLRSSLFCNNKLQTRRLAYLLAHPRHDMAFSRYLTSIQSATCAIPIADGDIEGMAAISGGQVMDVGRASVSGNANDFSLVSWYGDHREPCA